MAEVRLTRGYVALVDAADLPLLSVGPSWGSRRDGARVYAQRTIYLLGGERRTQQMHCLLTGWSLVDHINGDGLDNRRSNLRPATTAENNANATKRRDNSSGFKGVSMHKPTGRWAARIGGAGRIHLGYYATPEEAARVYDDAATKHFGEFARLNFPREESLT